MPTSYAKNKVHIYNYVEKNRDKINEISKNWRDDNNEVNNERRRIAYNLKMETYDFKRECKRFRNIELF